MKSTIWTLGVIMVIFFGLLLLLTARADKSSFRYSAKEMHQLVVDTDYIILPRDLAAIQEYRLIDLREPEEFTIAPMQGALNVPVSSVLDKEFEELFASEVAKVILAYDPVKAHGAWMLLTQLGYENLWVMELQEEAQIKASEKVPMDLP